LEAGHASDHWVHVQGVEHVRHQEGDCGSFKPEDTEAQPRGGDVEGDPGRFGGNKRNILILSDDDESDRLGNHIHSLPQAKPLHHHHGANELCAVEERDEQRSNGDCGNDARSCNN
jgi:hypothetical protein